MATLTPVPRFRAFDANGEPLAGGKVWTYTAGTSTPRATYTDESGTTPNTNPVILDANGEADIWLGNGYYKFVLMDADDVVQYTTDRINSGTGGNIGASDLNSETFIGNGVDTEFGPLATDPLVKLNTQVYITGAKQNIETYELEDLMIVFSEAPPDGAEIEVVYGSAMAVGEIPDNSITNAKLVNAAVSTAKILNAAVTNPKLADGSVSTGKLQDESVTEDKLAADSVSTNKIKDDTITYAKLGPGARPFLNSQTFVAAGSFTVPDNVHTIFTEGCGGGGGGGAGTGRTGAGAATNGGTGGCGAPIIMAALSVTPGQVISLTIGLGGNGATGTTGSGQSGGDGTASTFGSLTFPGGKGGYGAANPLDGDPFLGAARGRIGGVGEAPGSNGDRTAYASGGSGGSSAATFGGGGGGGGAAFGAGGAGANGNSLGGGNGTSAGANTGAGGGGSAGGSTSGGGWTVGNGGSGGSGRINVYW